MPDVGGDIRQSAPAAGGISTWNVPTTADRDRIASNGTARVGDLVEVRDGSGDVYEVLTTAPTFRAAPSVGAIYVVSSRAEHEAVPSRYLRPGNVISADYKGGALFMYTGLEAGAPDPSQEDAWAQMTNASTSWFRNAATFDQTERYLDMTNGSDVFGDGSVGNPFKTATGLFRQAPPPGAFSSDLFLFPEVIVKASSGERLDFSRMRAPHGSDVAFTFVAEDNKVAIDGGSTEDWSTGGITNDLTGPAPSGGAISKRGQGRLNTGVAVDSAYRADDGSTDGKYLVRGFDDFAIPGYQFFDVVSHVVSVHDLGELGANDLPIAGRYGGFASTMSLHALSTEVDGTAIDIDLPPDFVVTMVGIDFKSDVVAKGTFFGTSIRGVLNFQGCQFFTGAGNDVLAFEFLSTGAPINGCYCEGAGGGAGGEAGVHSQYRINTYEASEFGPGSRVNMNGTVFAASCLSFVGHRSSVSNCIFRGGASPRGGNNQEGRLVVGAAGLPNKVLGRSADVVLSSCDFERTPGDGVGMDGTAVVLYGASAFLSSNGNNTAEIEAGPFFENYGGTINVAQGASDDVEYGAPNVLHHAAQMIGTVVNASASGDYSGWLNHAVVGEDVQFGRAESLNDFVVDLANVPANDFPGGGDSAGNDRVSSGGSAFECFGGRVG